MKRATIFFFILSFITINIFAQDLGPILRDLSTCFEELGKEIVPFLQQNDLSGNHTGAAVIYDNALFFISISGGIVLSDGLLKFVDEENTNFEFLNVFKFVNNALSENDMVAEYFKDIKTILLYPNLRLSFGLKTFFDTETILLFSMIPQALVDSFGIEGFELDCFNVGIRLRKFLLEDHDYFPAISMGVGYTYSNMHIGYTINDFNQDLEIFTLSIEGSYGLDTIVHTAGFDFTISKKLLFIVPFFRISPWYQWTTYTAGMKDDFRAIFKNAAGDVIADSDKETEDTPYAELFLGNMNVILSTGFELLLGPVIITPGCSYSLYSNAFGLDVGLRMQL